MVSKSKLERFVKLGYVYGSRKKYKIIKIFKTKIVVRYESDTITKNVEIGIKDLFIRKIRNQRCLYFFEETRND